MTQHGIAAASRAGGHPPADRLANPVTKDGRIERLRASTPLPQLLRKLGLGRHAKSSCPSPLRADEKPSWGIYERDGRWHWKDHGTDEGGDELDFLAQLNQLDLGRDFKRLLDEWERIAQLPDKEPVAETVPGRTKPPGQPDCSGCRLGTAAELEQLCQLRGFDLGGMQWAQERGVLRFGTFMGYPCFGVTDGSRRLLEWRRLDGQPFPAIGELGERKSHTVRGSRKDWPVGIHEAEQAESILLVEGLPDLLAAHTVIWREDRRNQWAPVGLMGAGCQISAESLTQFRGKLVLIVPHLDEAGLKGAIKRQQQLKDVAAKVTFLLVDDSRGEPSLKDLNDYLPIHGAELANGKAVL